MSWPWRRRRREAELDEELAGHLAMAAREHEARGVSPEDAAYAARREFGNRTLVREATRAAWAGGWLDGLLQDLRLALRSLRRSPGFVLIAVLALGLGVGLSTTMFGVLDAVMNPRSGYEHPDRLYRITAWYGPLAKLTPGDLFRTVRDRSRAFDAVVPMFDGEVMLPEVVGAANAPAVYTTPDWFAVAGIRPMLGRAFTKGDPAHVVVLGEMLWRRLLGSRRDLAGAMVTLGDRSYAVVGVLSHDQSGVAQAVFPLTPWTDLSDAWGQPLVRLAPGVTAARAQGELTSLSEGLSAATNSRAYPYGLTLSSVRPRPEPLNALHAAMLGAALTVLLIACINLAHLMLARGIARRAELATRLALGASRGAAVRVMLVEAGLITAGGFAAGACVAVWTAGLLRNSMPTEVGWIGILQPELSWRVFALGACAAGVSALLFGLVPALRVALSVQLTEPLKDSAGTTTATGRRRYDLLVIGEVALALVLLMAGGLLLRTVQQLRAEYAGENAETLLEVNAAIRLRDSTAHVDWARVVAAVRAVPGVIDAAYSGNGITRGGAVTAELTEDTTRTVPLFYYGRVSPNYLRVHRLSIVRGRDFEPGDVATGDAAILSAAAAARLYPGQDPVGRMVKLGSPSYNKARFPARWVRVVGVARSPEWALRDVVQQVAWDPLVYVAEAPGNWRSVWLLVRAASRDAKIALAVQQAARIDPSVGALVFHYTAGRDEEMASRSFLADVFIAMGSVGLALAALGLFGVLSYGVTRRMREFAIRIALGAEPAVLFRTVMRDALVMLLAGTGVGGFGALAAAFMLNQVLIGVYPTDAISLVLAEAVLLAVGLAAAVGPARRAVRADPIEILRAT